MMRHWTLAALLGSFVVAGCGGDRASDTQNYEENKAAPTTTAPEDDLAGSPNDANAPTARAEESSPAEDTADTPRERTRATTGRTPRAGAAARGERTREPEVSAPRESARAERSAAPRAAEYREITVPEGTALPLELMTDLSSEKSQVEAPVRARLRQAVIVNGVAALPAGAVLSGHVTDVQRAGRVKGRASLAFTFTEVQADGVREDIRTNPLSFVADTTKGEDATKIGAGAVGGAIVGGLLGGGQGAAKGAAIGGAAGTGVVLATRGNEVELDSGDELAAALASPLKIRVPAR